MGTGQQAVRPAHKMPEITGNGLASHPRGSSNTPLRVLPIVDYTGGSARTRGTFFRLEITFPLYVCQKGYN